MKGKKKWRLSKTLSRHVDVRPIEDADVKYAWAAYRQGRFTEIGFSANLSPSEFKYAFERFVLENAHGAWTVLAQTSKNFMPIGITMGTWGPGQRFMVMAWTAWFPWASKRNIVEGTVAICNRLRHDFPLMCFANETDKKMYETCMMHGIVHRIGTSHSLGEKMTIFEARVQ